MGIINRVIGRIKREINLQINHQRIKRLIQSIQKEFKNDNKSPVVFFNASTRLSGLSLNAGFSLLTSLVLYKNNVPVFHFVCNRGLRPCVLGTDREDPSRKPPCNACIRSSRLLFDNQNVHSFSFTHDPELENRIQNLQLDQLLNTIFKDIPLGKVILPSLRWILRRHHLEDNDKNRGLASAYLQSAWGVYREFSKLLDDLHPRAVVVFNGMFYPEAIARFAAQERDIKVFSHEVGMLPFSAFFTDKEATAYPVEVSEDFKLSQDQEQRLDAYLEKRQKGHFQTAGVEFWPEMQSFDGLLRGKITSFKKMVPVFTNVIFDTSQSHANTIFKHMFAWLEMVLDHAKQHPETLFVIRAHPDENRAGKVSRESVSDWVAEKEIAKFQNIHFIPPDEYISSYDLIKRAKFVMVYNSTVGLEASIMGKPVLCAGKARYTQIPTVNLPETQSAYEKHLEMFLSAPVDHPKVFIENARRVLYSQLFRASLPFDHFLEEDSVWRGYVRIKKFPADLFEPGRSKIMDVVVNGILSNEGFIQEI